MDAIKPLTPDEAISLCHQYKVLVGKPMVCEYTDFFRIEHIVAAPFDETAKDLFASRFMSGTNAAESISFYLGNDFDVLIFARGLADKTTVLYASLQHYLQHECIDLTDETPLSYTG